MTQGIYLFLSSYDIKWEFVGIRRRTDKQSVRWHWGLPNEDSNRWIIIGAASTATSFTKRRGEIEVGGGHDL